MARRSANWSYREALLSEPEPSPLPTASNPRENSTANHVFTVQDKTIRENIRYRIYDFCFDIVYDKALKPSVMQYIRVLHLPPNPLFNQEHWERTMVHGHWSHEPRGFALLTVCKSVYREAYFRFYWFHFPNRLLPHCDIPNLLRRLRKIPEPHDRNVNAQVTIHCRLAHQKEIESPDAIFVTPSAMKYITSETGLDEPHTPWIRHTNVDGKEERIILGVGFHILEWSAEVYPVRSLSFVGKLGNMVFLPTGRGDNGGLDFKSSMYRPVLSGGNRKVKGIHDVFSHIRRHVDVIARATQDARAQFSMIHTQSSAMSREKQHASEGNPQENSNLASEDALHVSNPTSHSTPTISPGRGRGRGQSLSPLPSHGFRRRFNKHNSTGQLRGGDLLVLLHELSLHTLDLIDSLEHNDALRTPSLEKDKQLLMQEETRHSTHKLKIITMEEALRAHREESKLRVLDFNYPKPGSDMGEECGNSAASETSKQEHGSEDGQKTSKDPTETHTQFPVQTMRPLQLDESSLSDRGSAGAEFTHGQPTTYHTREPSFETRITQWMTRENDPMSSRKSSITWSNGKEAYELSSRKRVTSSNYRTSLSRRSLSDKHSSSAVHSTAALSTRSPSPKCGTLAATDTLAPQAPTTDVANPSAEPAAPPSSAPHHQAESSDPFLTTPSASTANQATASVTDHATAASPPPRDLPLPETTNAQITHDVATPAANTTTAAAAAAAAISPPPSSPRTSSRRASSSSNAASLCVGSNRRAEDEPIVVIPGAEQFLTPKRDAKPWWETGGGGSGSQSTGGKKRRKGREREARGSASSWMSSEGGGGGYW